MHAIIRLPCPQRGCKSTFPCIGHDIKHSFQRVLPVRGKSKEQSMWTFFHEMDAQKWDPIQLNGALHISMTIMQFFVASAVEAKLGALYHDCQTGIIFWLTLAEIRHLQPQTPVHCDNTIAMKIANNPIKRQRLQSMDMRFFWVGDKVAQEMYKLRCHPGQENLADYQSKHHAMSHHINICPWYLHMKNSLRFLPRAQKPSALKGCVGALDDGYIRNVPLLRAPRIQSASHVTCYGAVMRDAVTEPGTNTNTCYSQVACGSMWGNLMMRLLAGLGRCVCARIIPFSPGWLI